MKRFLKACGGTHPFCAIRKGMESPPGFLLLDRSYHHAAMKTLEGSEKRGRPDIIHFALLEALGSPLNKEGLLQVYVHTINDYIIRVDSEARLPRNHARFVGLIEQLFELGRTPPKGRILLELRRKKLPQLLHEIEPTYVVAFTRSELPQTLQELLSRLSDREKLALIVGGFPTVTSPKRQSSWRTKLYA